MKRRAGYDWAQRPFLRIRDLILPVLSLSGLAVVIAAFAPIWVAVFAVVVVASSFVGGLGLGLRVAEQGNLAEMIRANEETQRRIAGLKGTN